MGGDNLKVELHEVRAGFGNLEMWMGGGWAVLRGCLACGPGAAMGRDGGGEGIHAIWSGWRDLVWVCQTTKSALCGVITLQDEAAAPGWLRARIPVSIHVAEAEQGGEGACDEAKSRCPDEVSGDDGDSPTDTGE